MANQVNPYIAGSPVTGTEMFFGREDVFAFVLQTLTGRHQDQVIVLYGQRRTGKTSVLYQMHRHLGPRYLPIFVDLHGLALNSLADFLWELANHTRRSLKRAHGIEIPSLDRAEFMIDPRHGFEIIFLEQVWANSGDRHLLLMLDEAVRLQEQVQAGKLDVEVFAYLRHLMQHQARLNFLFSLGSGLEEMEKTYALLFNVALYKKISFLERGAAEALIIEPVRDLYQLEPAAVERILDVTSCHPYYSQLICHGLFNRWQQNQDSPLTVADVEATLDEAVERGLAVLKHVWEESEAAERTVLAGMSAAIDDHSKSVSVEEINQVWRKLDVFIPPGEIAKAIRSLIARDVITGHDHYRFTVDLQRRWLRQYERLEWVREEIAEEISHWTTMAPPPPPRPGQRLFSLVTSWKTWAVILPVVFVLSLLLIIINQETGGGDSIPVVDVAQTQVNDLIAAGEFVWAATDGGLLRWRQDGSNELVAAEDLGFPDGCVNAIDMAADGSLWIGCGGAAHFRSEGDQISSFGYYDRDGGLPMGVVRVLAVEQDGQTVMAGGPAPRSAADSPLAHFVDSWQPVTLPLEELNARGMESSILSILRDRDIRLWLGLERDGILLDDGSSWRIYGSESGVGADQEGDFRIRRLIQDSQGNIWAAAGAQGLRFYDPVTDTWQRQVVLSESEIIRDIAELDDNELWVAGQVGDGQGFVAHRPVFANPVEVAAGDWIEAGPGQDLGSDIHGLAQTADGNIWLGSYDGGVSVFDGQNWTHLQR